MAISAGGIGSGLDINALVRQLVAADRAPQAQRLNRQEAGANFRLSALGTLRNSFDGLSRALQTFGNASTYGARTVSSSLQDVFTATAGASVPPGSYGVEVLSLASAQKVRTAPLPEAATGAGTLRFSQGDTSFEVEVAEGDSPTALRDAINTAASAAGVKIAATVVQGDAGPSLVLTAQESGAAKAFRIEQVGGAGDLGGLTFDPADPDAPGGMAQVTGAADAQARIDGVLATSSTNQLTGAISGLTLNLKQARPGETGTLTIGADNTPARNAMAAFVTAYNASINALATATRYNAETGDAGALNGDALARGAGGALRNGIGAFLANAGNLGLKTRVDGTLEFSASTFEAAMAADPARVEGLVRGLGESMGAVVGRYIGNQGAFTQRADSLNAQLRSVSSQRDELDRRMEGVEARYMRQFTALDSLVAQLSSTGNFLSQQLANLPRINTQPRR